MKTYVHTYKVYAACLALAALMTMASACSEEQQYVAEPEQTEADNRKVPITLRAMQPGVGDDEAKPSTRLGYVDNLGDNGLGTMVVTWQPNDKIRLLTYNKDGVVNQKNGGDLLVMNTQNAEGDIVEFTGNVVPGANGRLYAWYNGNNEVQGDALDGAKPSFTWTCQSVEQDCNNPMAHLSQTDLLYATTSSVGSAMSFRRATTLLRFKVKLPQGTNQKINRVDLIAKNRIFYNQIKLNLANEIGWEASPLVESPTDVLSISLVNDVEDDEVTAYMMIAPVSSFADVDLKLRLTDGSGQRYESEFKSGNISKLEAGKCYTIRQDVTKTLPPGTIVVTPGNLKAALDAFDPSYIHKNTLILQGELNPDDLKGSSNSPKGGVLTQWMGDNCGIDLTLNLEDLNLTEIPEYAFYNSHKIKKVILPELCKKIGSHAFESSNLSEIDLGWSQLTEIGESAFEDCRIQDIYIQGSVLSIGNYAFKGKTAKNIAFEHHLEVAEQVDGLRLWLGNDVFTCNENTTIFLPGIESDEYMMTYKNKLPGAGIFYYSWNAADYNPAADGYWKIKKNYDKIFPAPSPNQ